MHVIFRVLTAGSIHKEGDDVGPSEWTVILKSWSNDPLSSNWVECVNMHGEQSKRQCGLTYLTERNEKSLKECSSSGLGQEANQKTELR